MAAREVALKFPQALVVGGRIMPRPVQPARLRNPYAGFLLVTGDGLQQQNLSRERELMAQMPIERRAPEEERAGKGKKMQFSRQIEALNRLGQQTKGAKGQDITHAIQRVIVLEQKNPCPCRQGAFPPTGRVPRVRGRENLGSPCA